MPKRSRGADDGFAELIEEHPVDPEPVELTPQQKEEQRKKRKLDKLERAVQKLSKKRDKEKSVTKVPSEIKNKVKRTELVEKKRLQKAKDRLIERMKKKKVRAEEGNEEIGKGETKTIESMRVADETYIEDAADEDIKGEEEIDEFASYFNNETKPKLLMTTNRRPKGVILRDKGRVGHFRFPEGIEGGDPQCVLLRKKEFQVERYN